jgi:opacity protein-like surface antigen
MGNTRLLAAAAATALFAIPAAHAADLGPPPPYQPAPIETSGWYLRGYVGLTNQQVDNAGFKPNPFPNDTITTQFATFDSSPLFGMGVGYQLNNWLRFDVTGEYRANSHFHGQQIDKAGLVTLPDDYNASKNELLFLANAYIDLGTWWCVTPFIGAGIGGSYNTITSFVDQGMTQSGLGGGSILSTTYADDHSKWSFAWALYAGLAYQVTPSFTVDLSYRYVNLGSAQTGPAHAFDGTVIPTNPFVFDTLTSHDLMLGVRWNFGEPPPPALMRKG